MRGQGGKIAFSFKHSAALFIILSIILLFSCGLPTAEYLYPPSFSSSGDSGLILIPESENIDLSSDYFLGYSIYYRIYEKSSDAQTALLSLVSLSNTYSNSPSSFFSLATSSSYNFRIMAKQIISSGSFSYDPPLIRVSDNSVSQFFLNLLTFQINNDTSYKIVRNIREMSDYSSRSDFLTSSNYISSDPDYVGTDNSPNSVYLIAFSVAYGYSKTTFTNIYSTPAFTDNPIHLTLN